MTIPFDQFVQNDAGNGGGDSGQTGTAGGSTTGGNTSTDTSTSTTTTSNTGNVGCQNDAECSSGYYCDTSTVAGYINDDPTNPYYGCKPTSTSNCPPQGTFLECSNVTGLGIFAGGDPPPGQPCYTFTAAASQCGTSVTCPEIGTFIRCTELQTAVGGIAEFSNGLQNGQCSSYTAVSDQCSPPPPPPPPPSTPPASLAACSAYGTFLDCTPDGRGIYSFGSRNAYGECETYAVYYDSACYNPPQPSPSPVPTPPASSPACPADGTFIACVNGTGNYYTGTRTADGSCATRQVYQDAACSAACPSNGTFVECNGQNGVYYNGQRASDGTCLTETFLNDARCVSCPSNGTFDQCVGNTGYYYDGTFANGRCVKYTITADVICGDSPPPATPPASLLPRVSNTPQPTPSATPSATPVIILPPVPSSSPAILLPVPSSSPTIPPAPSTTPVPTIELPPPSLIPNPTPSRTPQPTPPPTPSPSPIRWRDCIDGTLKDGNAPAGYREVIYPAAGGGTCWEPVSMVGFNPTLNEALTFIYQRGSSNLPQPKTITATNPSYGKTYAINLQSNPDIIITPSSFIIPPRQSVQFIVNVTPQLLDKLGDGSSALQMAVNIMEQ